MAISRFFHFGTVVLAVGLAGLAPGLRAAGPELLAEALRIWSGGKDDLSFVQRTRYLHDDGSLKEERVERYDPSLPDSQRWLLLEVDGRPPTTAEREQIQDRRNRKPRKKPSKSLESYFDVENATKTGESGATVTYEVPIRPETARLIPVDKLSVGIEVNRDTKAIERVTVELLEPMRIALGLAKITGVDLDLRFVQDEGGPADPDEKVPTDGTAKVTLSKFGNRAEYIWTDFKRVMRHQGGGSAGADGGEGLPAAAAAILGVEE